jgi:hypothetical protein
MPRVGFEPAIPVFQRVKTFHALARATTVTGQFLIHPIVRHHIVCVVEKALLNNPIINKSKLSKGRASFSSET